MSNEAKYRLRKGEIEFLTSLQKKMNSASLNETLHLVLAWARVSLGGANLDFLSFNGDQAETQVYERANDEEEDIKNRLNETKLDLDTLI